MDDIVPALLNSIQEEFRGKLTDEKLASVYVKISEGTGTYKTADEYAVRLGEILAEVFGNNISSAILPDGKMYYNIAKRLLEPTLTENYEMAAQAAVEVQTTLNKAAGIGIKAQKPTPNTDRIDGLIEMVTGADQYDDIAKSLLAGIENFTQSAVTDTVKSNADFQYKAGLSPKIVRTAESGACAWCQALAGTYDYSDVRGTGNDVWRRHEHCRCNVEYVAGNKRQNAHTKIKYEKKLVNIGDTPKKNPIDYLYGYDKMRIEKGELPVNLQFFAERGIKKESSKSLKKGIQSLREEIYTHEGYIKNPQIHVADWDELPLLEQEGLLKHWNKEIRNFNASIDERVKELKRRGDYDE